MPVRIQRKRTKGWRMPDGAVYVGRPTRWGNQFTIMSNWLTAEKVVNMFEESLNDWSNNTYGYGDNHSFEEFIAPLRGKDLACWCALDQPCHADVLLRYANKAPIALSGTSPRFASKPEMGEEETGVCSLGYDWKGD